MKNEFTLIVRRDDLEEIYSNQLNYKLFYLDNLESLLLLVLFLVFTFFSFFALNYTYEYIVLLFCFGFGLLYKIIQLIIQYLKFKKSAQQIYKWINETNQFLFHKVKVTEDAIIYSRDNEFYMYNFKEIKKTYRTNNHFYLSTITNDDILLPIKSFEIGEYEQFLKVFDSNKEKTV